MPPNNQSKEIISPLQNKQIEVKEIADEMQESYIDYAMSVIISRALPDVRDGLKPVHRRILYTMYEMGLSHQAKYKKSAGIVGETMAKYHPHGDASIYNSLVRMAQDFSLRYPLIQGQGNFGTIDDAPAQMRYTEARLAKITQTMFSDIEKETVDFKNNYDNTKKEPKFLPSIAPQLLLNGSLGIAVGMATNIPSHNLTEVCQALLHLIDYPHATIEEIFQFIKGPDFPEGGIIYNKEEIIKAYAQGKGKILIRPKIEINENGDSQGPSMQNPTIIIKELPFQTSKSILIENFDKLAREKKIQGIKDIRDESDKKGLKIVIELQKNSFPHQIVHQLYKLTNLEKFFYLNILVLVNEIEPKVLSLTEILKYHLEHRREIIYRKTNFHFQQIKKRIHILEGLSVALKNIDEIVAIIKKSKEKKEAKTSLMTKFNLSDLQAEAIVEMKLIILVKTESQKIQSELEEKKREKEELETILKSPQKIDEIIKQELNNLIEQYGDKRRTEVIETKTKEIKEESLIIDEETTVVLTQKGYIKRMDHNLYKNQHRGGKGILGIKTQMDDDVKHFILTRTSEQLLFFTDSGKVFSLLVNQIPLQNRVSKGRGLINFLPINLEEKILAILTISQEDQKKMKYLIMATKRGLIKKTNLNNFKNIRKSGLIAIKLKLNDALRIVKKVNQEDEIMLITKQAQAIRFKEEEIKAMSRVTIGYKGIKLKPGDELVEMETITPSQKKDYLLIITENGYGKRTKIENYHLQHRGGIGIKTAKITKKTGYLVKTKISNGNESLIVISNKGQVIKTPVKDISILNRVTQGVRIIQIKENDQVSKAICV